MAGYNDLPDKEDMMKEMAEVKKSAKNRKIARQAMNILGINDGRIVEDNGNSKKEEEDEEEEEEAATTVSPFTAPTTKRSS